MQFIGGTWLTLAATDEEVENFSSDDGFKFKPTYKLAKAIDMKVEGSTFHDVYEENSSLLHGMTHGGIEQIGKQFTDDGTIIQPTFEDTDLVTSLNCANANIGMILLSYSIFQNDKNLTKLAKDIIKGAA